MEQVDGSPDNHRFIALTCIACKRIKTVQKRLVYHLDNCDLMPKEQYGIRRKHCTIGQGDRSECAVRNCWEQWTREGTHARKTGSDATRETTSIEDRMIMWQPLVDPTVTRSTIREDVGVPIFPQRISRHLAEANLKSMRPYHALRLTPEHRQLSLQWCQARSMWNATDWQKDVFSHESRFVLGTDDNHVRVWRRSAYDSRSTLIVMRGTLTGQRYVDDIFRPHVGPFLNGLPGAIFQQDNGDLHT
ncbi:transposable element Tc1 transposase [Trichonephila clavipes]|nr:transposable element Tc1 transposase [Trichonephila clavipes]